MKEYINEFRKWIAESDEHKRMAQLWFRHYRIKRSMEFIEQYNAEASWKELEAAILKKKRNRQLQFAFSAIAASLLLILTFTYLMPHNPKADDKYPILVYGIEPFSETGGKKAILKLHTGEEVDLTNRAEHYIASEEDTLLIISPDQSLIYKQSAKNKGNTEKYNTLMVPRGGEYQLVLSDGTKVWLNAESSLHYPVSFSQIREVELTGEAYFEVSPHNIPFIIHTGSDHKVEVLGTKFNISAYTGNSIYTTLTEGKVKVHHASSSVILLPGNQAIAGKSGEISVEAVDTKRYTSWTQGIFQFRKTELSDIAAQLSRWYDVNISFSDEQLKHKLFTGTIFRHRELVFAVKAIERISNVRFIIKDDVIYITNQQKQ